MKGFVVLGEGELDIRDFAYPFPELDEVVVAIEASGMRGTGLNHRQGLKRSEDNLFTEGHDPAPPLPRRGRTRSSNITWAWQLRTGSLSMDCAASSCRLPSTRGGHAG